MINQEIPLDQKEKTNHEIPLDQKEKAVPGVRDHDHDDGQLDHRAGEVAERLHIDCQQVKYNLSEVGSFLFFNNNYPQHNLTKFFHYVRHEEMTNQEIPLE